MSQNLPKANGAAKAADLSTDAILEALTEGIRQLTEQVESMQVSLDELKESVANISTPAVDLGNYDDYE